MRERFLRNGPQEVALILGSIDAASQYTVLSLSIVPCGYEISAVVHGKSIECTELNLSVAHDVWVRRPASLVLVQQVVNYSLLVLSRGIERMERNLQTCSDTHGITTIFCPGTGHTGRIPALDENAGDRSTPLLKKRSSYCRIDPSGESYEYALTSQIHV